MEEQGTAELLVNSGGRRFSVDRAGARRSEPNNGDSTVVAFLQEKGVRERMSTSRSSRTTPWRSCTPSMLTSGAWSSVWVPKWQTDAATGRPRRRLKLPIKNSIH